MSLSLEFIVAFSINLPQYVHDYDEWMSKRLWEIKAQLKNNWQFYSTDTLPSLWKEHKEYR